MRGEMEEYVARCVSGDPTSPDLPARLTHRLAGDDRARTIMIDVILSASKLLRRDERLALRDLLIRLQLHQCCYQNLQYGTWSQQAYAARVLSQLQVIEALPLLHQKLVTRNVTLRLELITALVSLGDHAWQWALPQKNVGLSDWEQLQLLERFRRLEPDQIPDFGDWLLADHPDWVRFGIRLCSHYNRFDKIADLGLLLAHPDGRIQQAVLDAFDYLGLPEALPYLITYLERVTGQRLTRTLQVLGNHKDPTLVVTVMPFVRHADGLVRLGALEALKTLGLNRNTLRQFSSDPRYIDHLFDPVRP